MKNNSICLKLWIISIFLFGQISTQNIFESRNFLGEDSSEHFLQVLHSSRLLAESIDNFESLINQIQEWLNSEQNFIKGIVRLNVLISAEKEIGKILNLKHEKNTATFFSNKIKSLKIIARDKICASLPGSQANLFLPSLAHDELVGFLFKSDFDETMMSLNQIKLVFSQPWSKSLDGNSKAIWAYKKLYYEGLESFIFLILHSMDKIAINEKMQHKFAEAINSALVNAEKILSCSHGAFFRKDLQEIINFMLSLQKDGIFIFNSSATKLYLVNLLEKIKESNEFQTIFQNKEKESFVQKDLNNSIDTTKTKATTLHNPSSGLFSQKKLVCEKKEQPKKPRLSPGKSVCAKKESTPAASGPKASVKRTSSKKKPARKVTPGPLAISVEKQPDSPDLQKENETILPILELQEFNGQESALDALKKNALKNRQNRINQAGFSSSEKANYRSSTRGRKNPIQRPAPLEIAVRPAQVETEKSEPVSSANVDTTKTFDSQKQDQEKN